MSRIEPESTFPKWLHTLGTLFAAGYTLYWLWGWLGAHSQELRQQTHSLLSGVGTNVRALAASGGALASGGYLVWRALTWFYWRKYFGDQEPPEI